MKKKLNFIILHVALFVNESAYSYGSYLFCTNNSAHKTIIPVKGLGWNWAKGSNNNNLQATPIDNYANIAKIFSQGTWINGTPDLSAINGYYLVINHIFENQTAAINFCETLKQKCQSDWGEVFTGVGASTWDIPIGAWGSIAVRYKNQLDNYQWIACKNWTHINYLPLRHTQNWFHKNNLK